MAWPSGYTQLPHLVTGGSSQIWGISPDGTTVVGESNDVAGVPHATYWTISGIVDLGLLPSGTYALCQGASSDGSVIAGYGDSSGVDHAWKWTGSGLVELPVPDGAQYSYAYGVSPDGSIIVGEYGDPISGNDVAVYWPVAGGSPVVLPTLAGGSFNWTIAANTDGSVLIGTGDDASVDRNPFRWTSGGGTADLGQLFSGQRTIGSGVSGDGSTVAGWGYVDGTNTVSHAYSWTQGGGFVDLQLASPANPSISSSTANNISQYGSRIVGSLQLGSDAPFWMWYTPSDGMQAGDSLVDEAGFSVQQNQAYGCSSDGQVVALWGMFPQTDLTVSTLGVYWTVGDTLVHYLEAPAASGSYANPIAVSDDGSVIVGFVWDGGASENQPAMWLNGALTLLTPPMSAPAGTTVAFDVSGDSSTIVGRFSGGSCYWKQSGGVVTSGPTVLPVLPGDDTGVGALVNFPGWDANVYSGSRICSTDGTKIIGHSTHNNSPSPSTATGVVWTNGSITTSLPNSNPPGGVFLYGCTTDGIATIAGYTFDGSSDTACFWLSGTTQHDSSGYPGAQALALDESGTVINLASAVYVDSLSTNHGGTPPLYGNGHSRTAPVGYEGINAVHGFAPENGLLACGAGTDGSGNNQALTWNGTTPTILGALPGSVVSRAYAMSGDGSVVVGYYWGANSIEQPICWESGTAVALESPFPGANAYVQYVSRDGSVGVGFVNTPPAVNIGFVFSFAAPSPPPGGPMFAIIP